MKKALVCLVHKISLDIQLAYSFANILPANATRLVQMPIFIYQLIQISPFTNFLALQYFTMHSTFVEVGTYY